MVATFPFARFERSVFSGKPMQALAVSFSTGVRTTFCDDYQNSKCIKQHPSYFSLSTLLKATDRTAETYQQFDLDDRNIRHLAKSIFHSDKWLMIDPIVAKVEHSLYLVGGRHRIHAIAAVFASLAKLVVADDHEASLQSVFETYLEQEVRCELIQLVNMENLLTLISADNEGRTMRKPEKMHLKAQVLGAEFNQPMSAIQTALYSDLAPVAMKNVAAQNFVWRDSRRLQPDTKQRMGERIAHYLLFGVKPNEKIGQTVTSDVVTIAKKFDIIWEILLEVSATQNILARNVPSICDKAIQLYEERYPELLTGIFEPRISMSGSEQTSELSIDKQEEVDEIINPSLVITENKNELNESVVAPVKPIEVLPKSDSPLQIVGLIKSATPEENQVDPTKQVDMAELVQPVEENLTTSNLESKTAQEPSQTISETTPNVATKTRTRAK